MTDYSTPSANRSIGIYFCVGIGLLILGGLIAGSAWPDTEEIGGYYGDRTEATGSMVGTVFGFIVAGVGQLFVLIGAIAKGVQIGRRP